MLTPRQKEVLQLIIQLYGQWDEPIGSKRLLSESYLKVSPATIRNDMVVLEQEGFLSKAHTSSGRVPSEQGYRYYVNRIIDDEDLSQSRFDNEEVFRRLVRNHASDPIQMANMAVEVLVNMTGYLGVVLSQNHDEHYFRQLTLISLTPQQALAMLMTDNGKSVHQVLHLPLALSEVDLARVAQTINDELRGSPLDIAYQRLKLSIPIQIQRLIGYQLDFSDLAEQALLELKTHYFKVFGKANLFDIMGNTLQTATLKHLFRLIDGSKELFEIMESGQQGVNVVFGFEIAPDTLAKVSIIFVKYQRGHQQFSLGLIGPSTMAYHRMIALMHHVATELVNA